MPHLPHIADNRFPQSLFPALPALGKGFCDGDEMGVYIVDYVNGEPGEIPGSKAYRNAWCEMFLDSHSMWEDHEWERYMAEHPLAQIRRMSLEDMKPVVDETEKWLGSHPGADREYIRGAVMKEFISHIWGTEPMRDIRTICVEACCKEV